MSPIPRTALMRFYLERYERYLDILNTSLKTHQNDLEAWFENQLKEFENNKNDISDEFVADFTEMVTGEIEEVEGEFPRNFFSSFLVSFYSFIENELIQICVSLKPRGSISIWDFNPNEIGIKRTHKYLSEVIGYEIDNIHWQKLNEIRHVRNYIVHSGNLIPHLISVNADMLGSVVEYQNDFGNKDYLLLKPNLYQHLIKNNIFLANGGLCYINPTYSYCRYIINFCQQMFFKIYSDRSL